MIQITIGQYQCYVPPFPKGIHYPFYHPSSHKYRKDVVLEYFTALAARINSYRVGGTVSGGNDVVPQPSVSPFNAEIRGSEDREST